MGSLVRAMCSCGYSESVAVGGLRADYLHVSRFPFLCRDCKRVFSGDLYQYRNTCADCSGDKVLSYRHPSLFIRSKDSVVVTSSSVTTMFAIPENYFQRKWSFFGWLAGLFNAQTLLRSESYVVEVMSHGYYCPQCDSHGLHFKLDALID